MLLADVYGFTSCFTVHMSNSKDILWNASEHPVPDAASIRPKPDFTVGFRSMTAARRDLRILPVWSEAYIDALQKKQGLRLLPYVISSETSTHP